MRVMTLTRHVKFDSMPGSITRNMWLPSSSSNMLRQHSIHVQTLSPCFSLSYEVNASNATLATVHENINCPAVLTKGFPKIFSPMRMPRHFLDTPRSSFSGNSPCLSQYPGLSTRGEHYCSSILFQVGHFLPASQCPGVTSRSILCQCLLPTFVH